MFNFFKTGFRDRLALGDVETFVKLALMTGLDIYGH